MIDFDDCLVIWEKNEKEFFGCEKDFFMIIYLFWKLVVKKIVKMFNELIILLIFINKINVYIS